MNTLAKKLKKQPSSQEQGGTDSGREQTIPVARDSKRGHGAPKAKMPTSRRDDSSATSPDHSKEADDYARLLEMLGTTDPDFAKGVYEQLIRASNRANGQYDAVGLFFCLATMKGKKPKDQLQAMLLVQATVTHVLAMTQASQLARADNLPMQDSAERAFNKLTRTFILQFEALNRLETGGEQKVTVQNVSVNEGGQAIVGNVTQGAREQPAGKTPALPDARQGHADRGQLGIFPGSGKAWWRQ